MKKVGIIGHFGFGLDLANGQTIKTKIVADSLVKKFGDREVVSIDAHGGIKAVVPVIAGCKRCLKECDNVVILLTENGLKVAVPTLFALNKQHRKKLHYVVIGGWLTKFLGMNKWLIQPLKSFDCIYVETNTMKSSLEEMGFSNVIVMPNCKQLSIVKDLQLTQSFDKPLKICTFSRVMREKGIEDIVDSIIKINTKNNSVVYSLDIYGQVDAAQTEWFEQLKESFPMYIKYGGVVPFNQSVDVLKDYFLLLFPTKFYTEGIPGTIIDAYAAGVPVLAARWESFSDVVDEGKTGFGFQFGDSNDMMHALEELALHPEKVSALKKNCVEKAQDYTIDSAMNILIERL